MKRIFEIFSGQLSARLNNKLLGTFVFVAIGFHAKDIVKFLLSDDLYRLNYLNNINFSWANFGWIIFFTCIYVLVTDFFLPFIQGHLDKVKYDYIDEKRLQAEEEANLTKIKAGITYQEKALDREMLSWIEDRNTINTKVDKLTTALATAEETVRKYEKQIQDLSIQLQNAQPAAENYKTYTRIIESIDYSLYSKLFTNAMVSSRLLGDHEDTLSMLNELKPVVEGLPNLEFHKYNNFVVNIQTYIEITRKLNDSYPDNFLKEMDALTDIVDEILDGSAKQKTYSERKTAEQSLELAPNPLVSDSA
ncbi:hypothetical protein AB6D10_23990 [Vibrio splendidus]